MSNVYIHSFSLYYGMAVIALDIGGTKIKAGIVSKKGIVLSSIKIPTNPKQGKKKLVNSIKIIIKSLIDGSKHKITAIGISMPGFSDETGKLLAVGNILSFLEGFNIKQFLEKNFNLPVVVNNDSLCFTVAESIYGAGKNKNLILGVIWGSGIGAGLIRKESSSWKPYSGYLGSSIEFGHIPVYDFNSKKFTELELLCGGAFLTKRYSKLGGKIKNPTVGDIFKSKEKIAKNLMDETFQHLGRGIATVVNILNPEVIVLGGGVAKLPSFAYKKLFSQIKKYSLKSHTKNLSLKRFEISDDEGLLGAAYFASSLGK